MKNTKTQAQIILIQLLDYLGVSTKKLAEKTGLPESRFADIKRGKTKEFKFETVTKICEAYPDIHAGWLYGKDDNMLVRNIGNSTNTGDETPAHSGNPYFTIFTARGGYGHGDGKEQALTPDGYMSVPGIQVSNDIPFIQVRGKSMINTKDPEHSIPPGSWIAVKRVLGETIRWGEVYAIETVDGPIVKRIMPSEKENSITCESFNDAYPPFELPFTDIVDGALYLVKGVVNIQIWN